MYITCLHLFGRNIMKQPMLATLEVICNLQTELTCVSAGGGFWVCKYQEFRNWWWWRWWWLLLVVAILLCKFIGDFGWHLLTFWFEVEDFLAVSAERCRAWSCLRTVAVDWTVAMLREAQPSCFTLRGQSPRCRMTHRSISKTHSQ